MRTRLKIQMRHLRQDLPDAEDQPGIYTVRTRVRVRGPPMSVDEAYRRGEILSIDCILYSASFITTVPITMEGRNSTL